MIEHGQYPKRNGLSGKKNPHLQMNLNDNKYLNKYLKERNGKNIFRLESGSRVTRVIFKSSLI